MNRPHTPDPEGTLARRLAHLRATATSPWPGEVGAVDPDPEDWDQARRIVHSVRLEVRWEEAARSARLSLRGLLWVIAGTLAQVLFNTIFEVPVLALAGAVCSLIGLVVMLFGLRAQHQEFTTQRDTLPPALQRWLDDHDPTRPHRWAESARRLAGAPGRWWRRDR